MNLRLSREGEAANVLIESSGVNSLTRFVFCATNLARISGCAASLFFCVDPSCADGFPPRFVQIAFQHLLVDWQPSHDVQLFLDSIVLPTSDPSGNPLNWSPYANAAFCKWHSSTTVGPASTASIAPMSCSKTRLNPRRTDTAKLIDGAVP